MLITRTDDLQLLPDTTDPIWTAVSALLLIALVLLVVWLVLRTRRATERRRSLEERVERLEQDVLEGRRVR